MIGEEEEEIDANVFKQEHVGVVDDLDDIFEGNQGLVESGPELQDGRQLILLNGLALAGVGLEMTEEEYPSSDLVMIMPAPWELAQLSPRHVPKRKSYKETTDMIQLRLTQCSNNDMS